MNNQEILQEIQEQYSEWLEHAGDNSPAVLINILVGLLAKERSQNQFYEKLVKIYYDSVLDGCNV